MTGHARSSCAVAVSILVSFGATCGGTTPEQSELAYTQRLRLAEALAERYPGDIDPEAPLGAFGLWAGIIVQTRWQYESGRDRIPLWSLLNSGLSVEPATYAHELEAAEDADDPGALCAASPHVRAHPTPPAEGPPVGRVEVCEAWVRYFQAVEQNRPRPTLQRLLWDAHTVALIHGLREHREALDRADVTTDLERNFWASWIEIVLVLEALSFPTVGAVTVAASDALMPSCSPIGAEGCGLTRSDLGDAMSFVAPLAGRPASIDRIFVLYEVAHANPAAVLPLALQDPALARALIEYRRLATDD